MLIALCRRAQCRLSVRAAAPPHSTITTAPKRKAAAPIFVCQDCGADSVKWSGQCPGCEAWNTLKQFQAPAEHAAAHLSPAHFRANPTDGYTRSRGWVVAAGTPSATHPPPAGGGLIPLHDVSYPHGVDDRGTLGSAELDRLFGGGLVAGSVVLLGGPPGCGKSTLMLQVAGMLAGATTADGAPYFRSFCNPHGGPARLSAGQLPPVTPSAAPPSHVVAYISGEESQHQL